jgi:anti-anti-sigma factor
MELKVGCHAAATRDAVGEHGGSAGLESPRKWGGVAMPEDSYPVQWMGQQAVVALPEHIDVSNAGLIREQLLSLINRGAAILIADMTVTVSCDHAGADAMVRAYQRATVSGTQLRLVVFAPVVRRVLSLNGLDRLVSIYSSLEAAIAAGAPAAALPPLAEPAGAEAGDHVLRLGGAPKRGQRGPGAVITLAALRQLADALADGVALTDADGVLVLVNRRLEEMFGYEHGELGGQPVETLIPADLQQAHRIHRAGYAQAPKARPMGAGARLVGLRKDGATFPVEISLSPVLTATGHLVLALVRDVTQFRPRDDLADLARAAVTAEQAHRGQELLDKVTTGLYHLGLSLQGALDLPADVARDRIADALQRLDDAIREIRDHLFTVRGHPSRPQHPPPNGER